MKRPKTPLTPPKTLWNATHTIESSFSPRFSVEEHAAAGRRLQRRSRKGRGDPECRELNTPCKCVANPRCAWKSWTFMGKVRLRRSAEESVVKVGRKCVYLTRTISKRRA